MFSETPTQVKFSEATDKRLARICHKTGIKKVDLIRLAVDRALDSLKTTDQVVEAVVRFRMSANAEASK